MIEINKNPSPRDLAWFGVLLAAFLALVGLMLWWQTGHREIAGILILVGAVLAVAYYAMPPLRKPMFLGWMYAAFPIGWTVSTLMLVAAYYLVLVPIGLVMRAFGHDPMQRKLEPDAVSYWIERGSAPESGRYFRQW